MQLSCIHGYDKAGYKILDQNEWHMYAVWRHSFRLKWCIFETARIYRKSIGHFTDFAFVKRMQMFNITKVIILEKGVNISRKEVSFSFKLSELLLQSYSKRD